LVSRNASSANTDEQERIKTRAESSEVFCRLLIDGKFVSESKRATISFPSFEVNISD